MLKTSRTQRRKEGTLGNPGHGCGRRNPRLMELRGSLLRGRAVAHKILSPFHIHFSNQEDFLPREAGAGAGLTVPDREPDDTEISFYPSQRCPAPFPQESTRLPLVRHISIPSFLKTTVHGSPASVPFSRPETGTPLCVPSLLLVFQTEGRRRVCEQWS